MGTLLRSEDTGGALAVIEYDLAPGTLVAPLHTHSREDEHSYVIEGELGVQVGDRILSASAGEVVVKPRGTPHTLWNTSQARCRVLELIVPGGFERCLETLHEGGRWTSDRALVDELWAQYGIEMDYGSVPALERRLGIAFG